MEGKIGVFDSGIGGVTVLREIIKLLPNENYIYYSDSKNIPYGDKPNEEVINIAEEITKCLINQNCKIIVIACNTASAKTVTYLRKKYTDIIFVAIEPAYKMVHDFAYEGETLVLATKGTVESEKFKLLYEKYDNNKTTIVSCLKLADVIENGSKKDIIDNLEENIGEYKGKIKNVVLGCTHYPLAKDEIKEVLGEVTFFDGSKRLAVHLKNLVNENINKSGEIKKTIEKEKNTKQSKKELIQFIDSSNEKLKEERFFNLIEN